LPKLLLLDHHGASVPALVQSIKEAGCGLDVVQPEKVTRSSAAGYDGVIASGGYLRSESHGKVLQAYSGLLEDLDVPFLGICLGMKVIGYCFGARIRRIPPAVGMQVVKFHREFPLAPMVEECLAYQSHKYELLLPLPGRLENFATGESPVQAIKAKGRELYGVQFHPELSQGKTRSIIENFVARC
jgi:GMP synthase (glutamine-hydrolysing)